MYQELIDKAVKIATRAAMSGHPVERVVWIPPKTAQDDTLGSFVLIPCESLHATDIPPWEK